MQTEMVKDESRIKGTVMKVRPIDFAKEGRVLLAAINKYVPSTKA